ncbi:histidine kinase dimerization/phospho-acceptor domain-containing protein [Asticcacaulis sp. AC402]|uniref:histidine kinase dimerization/phospho-acceptor domain-containing protein n=1 Tax=Asticcacaulis sp. AC402 TaxID=1282361 RepID=UPI0003C3C837|nr:histidine kinase dimerization/phospho-acceptor domain-containing protein [Asticcacaulis sp. AC402]ESQ77247.1 histidine kinase [Asticcacaulis sp. AC402]
MDKRKSVWNVVPAGSVIGMLALVGIAMLPVLRPFLIYAALLVVAFTLYKYLVVVGDAESRIKSLKAPEKQIKVQPQGPSFQEVLRAIPDPVMIVSGIEPDDIAGRWIVFANTAAQTMFRMDGEGGLLVSTIRNPEVLECVDEALFGGISASTVYDLAGGARDQIWRAYSSPLPVTGPQRLALLTLRDETDARRMERMRADFLANASHELRTPLASLTGFIETLRGSAREDEKAREKFLDIMATQAERMRRLIQDLLSLSRIELNEHVPPSGEADLTLAARDVADGLSLMARDKRVNIVIRAPKPGLYPIIGDRDQILQVMQNLVDNALKYAPAGSEILVDIRYDLTLEQAVAGSNSGAARLVLLRPDRNVHDFYAQVTVRDAGSGIRREFLPRLAERFYRVEGQKSGDKLGTGLGLAIVKHIINRHRGGLVVESQSVSVASATDVLERTPTEKVASLHATEPVTFTAFSACFPQARAHGIGADTPRLVISDGLPRNLKDAV